MTSGSDRSDALAGRTFELASLGGTPALEAPTAVLTFGRDGRMFSYALMVLAAALALWWAGFVRPRR